MWGVKDLNLRSVNASDLQSDPFDHSGNPPKRENEIRFLLLTPSYLNTVMNPPSLSGRSDGLALPKP